MRDRVLEADAGLLGLKALGEHAGPFRDHLRHHPLAPDDVERHGVRGKERGGVGIGADDLGHHALDQLQKLGRGARGGLQLLGRGLSGDHGAHLAAHGGPVGLRGLDAAQHLAVALGQLDRDEHVALDQRGHDAVELADGGGEIALGLPAADPGGLVAGGRGRALREHGELAGIVDALGAVLVGQRPDAGQHALGALGQGGRGREREAAGGEGGAAEQVRVKGHGVCLSLT